MWNKIQRLTCLTPHLKAHNVFLLTSRTLCMAGVSPGKILVEFSSPNIAKPFHVGHLRSTIIGNFVANLFEDFQQSVVRINYLGDWGTQFGYLKLGVEMLKLSEEQLKNDPIKLLYQAYVAANQKGKEDAQIAENAREIFSRMELEDSDDLTRWNLYRDYTVNELQKAYSRLGVHFDQYDWESMYCRRNIEGVLSDLRDKEIIMKDPSGKEVIEMGDRYVAVVKSDGTTLYLARDIAAMLDRKQKHNFSHLYYIVDTAQTDHFKALFHVAQKVGIDRHLSHVKFGRIRGMSTRKGSVVFLEEILDEARDIMKEKQMKSSTTRVNLEDSTDKTSDILGISAVIVNDLKQRRAKDYTFDWKHALQTDGDTGIKLQYTHCRLYSLAMNTGVQADESLNPELLPHTKCQEVVQEIDRFPAVLASTRDSLEACILVKYLFDLCNTVSRCLKTARVKQEPSVELQRQRLLIFNTARKTLARGMRILGLTPLERM
ncbi:probable arginine--tRNA ligase, mitochondrial [Phlebotomus argentipes]|uniref:probable arginine--tRNA ligase, mitochondrial n=1 Tax=Phlebotomus argentipes TaxID=94469 RepID=UPI002892E7E7|nr:probable arginine--tRNA ligase, mitochondrial [Phlebotomus argentipes]